MAEILQFKRKYVAVNENHFARPEIQTNFNIDENCEPIINGFHAF